MAAKRSPKQRGEIAAFIDELYARSGATTWAEFASDAGVHAVSLSSWHKGQSVPDGYNVLKLIRAAGGLPQGSAAHPQADVPHRLEALEARVGELPTAADLQRGLQALQKSIDSLASRGTGEAARARKKASR